MQATRAPCTGGEWRVSTGAAAACLGGNDLPRDAAGCRRTPTRKRQNAAANVAERPPPCQREPALRRGQRPRRRADPKRRLTTPKETTCCPAAAQQAASGPPQTEEIKKTGVQTGLHPPTKVPTASASEPATVPRQAPQVPSTHTRINAHCPSAPVPLLTTPPPSPPSLRDPATHQRDASKCWAAAVQAAQKYLPTASAPSARTCSQTHQR